MTNFDTSESLEIENEELKSGSYRYQGKTVKMKDNTIVILI